MISRETPTQDYVARFRRAQTGVRAAGYAALLLTTPCDVRYFTGFASQLLVESPTRPCMVVVPRTGDHPILLCPQLWETAARQLSRPQQPNPFLVEVRTWSGIQGNCVAVVRAALGRARRGAPCATPMGRETHTALPLAQVLEVMKHTGEWVDASELVRSIRGVKSPTEIGFIQQACAVASEALHTVVLPPHPTERSVARAVRIACLQGGADTVPFVVVVSGPDGYGSIVAEPTDRPLQRGDVVAIDVGCTYNGYWCDFNRNYAVGEATTESLRLNALLWDATEVGLAAVRPGLTFGAVWEAMTTFLVANGCDAAYYETGRQGHGVGHSLTDPPSVCRGEPTVLRAGMVLTLEPSLCQGGKQWVHEENLVVTSDGYSLLSTRAPRELPVLHPPT